MQHAPEKFWNPRNKRSLYLGIILFILALIIQISAGRYSSKQAAQAPSANDLFLDNVPVVHLDLLIVGGGILTWAILAFLFAKHHRHLLFGLKAVSLFIIVRAFFINLTHLGLYPTTLFEPPAGALGSIYNLFTFQGNFFFSGHTGFPFLLALIFWHEKHIRRFFLSLSVLFGAAVLLAHVHYSIDIFAAPFITYGVFACARKIFYADYHVLHEKYLKGS